MRVDWCVSSWFRIKNTHSLTSHDCPAPLRVAMRSPLPFPCVPDRPYKILLVQVGTLSFSHPSFGVPVLFIYYLSRPLRDPLSLVTRPICENGALGWCSEH